MFYSTEGESISNGPIALFSPYFIFGKLNEEL